MASTTEGKVHNIDKPGDIAKLVKLAKSSGDARAVAEEKAQVEKIVIGPSPGSEAKGWGDAALGGLAEVDWATFPKLTHLYLWSVPHLTAIKGLPEALQCLDMRGCTGLVRLPKLPASLETLVTDGCTALKNAGSHELNLPALTDLSMRDCPNIEPAFVHVMIEKARNLRLLDVSGSRTLATLPAWPPHIEVARFKGCASLEKLPGGPAAGWPEKLRRIDLSGTAITSLPPLSASLDHVDLTGLRGRGLGTTELWPRKADAERPRPRTLYLHRSGLLVPPVAEQGEDAEDNVARSFRGFHEDIDLVGRVESRRCKILLVGNGNAGKTTLAYVLRGLDPDHGEGSTHGIRFYPYVDPGDPGTKRLMWDFGGQEIYHNAHRIFIKAGTVFLVVWNPLAPETATAGKGGVFEDLRRPPRYWIDMIRLACPNARICLVCNPFTTPGASVTTAPTEVAAVEDRFRTQARVELGDLFDTLDFFVCNARSHDALTGVAAWLNKTVAEIVSSQGTAVPAHWKVAEAMVDEWIANPIGGPAAGVREPTTQAGDAGHDGKLRPPTNPVRIIPDTEFANCLTAAIRGRVTPADRTGLDRLVKQVDDGQFTLTATNVDGRGADRTRRTLDFLTHSGLVYWNPAALADRVVIDQKWFLDGVYAVLQRPLTDDDHNEVWSALSTDPIFTRERLAKLVWDRPGTVPRYSVDEQELLLDFMEKMGLCFPLVEGARAWTGVTSYVSVQHLRKDADAPVAAYFDAKFSGEGAFTRGEQRIDSLHVGLWEQALAWLGRTFGGDGRYAEDVVVIERNKAKQSILVRCTIDSRGIGGTIEVRVSGPDPRDVKAEEKLCKDVLDDLVVLCSPESTKASRTKVEQKQDSAGGRSEEPRVFISYAWNPKTELEKRLFGMNENLPEGYEAPVDSLRAALQKRAVSLWWDRLAFQDPQLELDSFLNRVTQADIVLVCHSQRYWTRPYCMFELKSAVYAALRESSKRATIVFVGLADDCSLDNVDFLSEYISQWRVQEPKEVVIPISADLVKPVECQAFRDEVATLLESHLQKKLQSTHARYKERKLEIASCEAIADWFVETHVRRKGEAGIADPSVRLD
jgi:GTPase SAR1 family protein